MEVWRERSLRATMVLLGASFFLIGPSLPGFGASFPLLGVYAAIGGGLIAARPRLTAFPTVVGHDLGTYTQDLWASPVLGLLLVVIIEPTASPAELQAIGGLAGLVGMINYFVRPVYLGVYAYLRRFLSTPGSGTTSR